MFEPIDQRRMPGVSRLFADYLYAPERTRAFLPVAPYPGRELAAVAHEVRYSPARRNAMALELARQNQPWSSGAATLALIDRFAQPDAVAVLTGQQVGYLGGPLLALLKAATAVRLAAHLRELGVNAVPIFWMATQDHDRAEIDHAWLLDAESRPVRAAAALEQAAAAAPVGALRLAAAAPADADPAGCYAAGRTLGESFARLLQRWFTEAGLIVFDPLMSAVGAAEVQPYLLEAFRRGAELDAALETRDRALEAAGYHVQVRPPEGSTLLFLHRDGERVALRRGAAGEYRAGSESLSDAEVRAWIESRPQEVSAAALLRPLLQDTLFPTLASVTGPSETAYLAQSAVLYAALNQRQPHLYPRASATLIDAKGARLLRRYGVGLEQIWHEPVAELLGRQALPDGLAQRMQRLRTTVSGELEALRGELQTMDPTLIDAARTAGEKIGYQLEQFEGRLSRSLSRRSEELRRHAQFLSGHLYPDGNLQERLLCAAAVAPGENGALAAQLLDRLALDCPDHQQIEWSVSPA